MKIDWKKKLTSRKFWFASATFVTGIILLITGGVTEQGIMGCVMSLGSAVAYIVGEGLADASNNNGNKIE